jgi:hypothetical protein
MLKNTQILNFMTFRLAVAQLLDADRQTDGRTDRPDVANSSFFFVILWKRLKTVLDTICNQFDPVKMFKIECKGKC